MKRISLLLLVGGLFLASNAIKPNYVAAQKISAVPGRKGIFS